MMKKLIALCAAAALMISATGCVGVGFSSYGGKGGRGEEIQGSGLVSTLNGSFDKMSSLTIAIPGELYYTVGEPEVAIELYANQMQYVTVSENDGAVIIDSDKTLSVQNDHDMPKIYVSAPSLEALNIDGVVNLKEMDTITTDSFKLDIDGVFKGTIALAVQNLTVDMDGVGNVTLTGTADNAVIDMSGVGNLKAFDLQAKVAEIETSGVGNAEISCSEKLTAKARSVGSIYFKGSPDVEMDTVTGMGKVEKAG